MNRAVYESLTLIDSIPSLAWSALPDGSALAFNRRWLAYTGLTTEEALGWGWKVAIHPDDLPKMMKVLQKALAARQPFEWEARLQRADGEYRRFLFRGDPVLDESGNVAKWFGTSIDLEDRTRAGELLRASEKSFRSIVDTIPGLVAIMNAEGGVEFVNNQVLQYFGKSLEELKSWQVGEEVHPDDLPLAVASWLHSVETGDRYDVDHRLRGANGTYRWFHARGLPQRDPKGCIVRWYHLLIDIEDRKRVEDRLRLLLDLNNRVAANLDLREVFQAISSELRRIFKSDFVGMALPENDGKQLRQYMVDFPGGKGLLKEGALSPIEGSLTGLAYRSAKRVAINSRDEAGSVCSFDARFRRRVSDEGPFQSGCFLPLINGDRVLGVLQLASLREHAFSSQDAEFLDQVANQIAITLKHALQYERVAETKDRLQDENVALREEIDQAFMFEEIVGSSPALKTVLSSVVKVAPTDSTVLISGDTGTGKELIARAIHRRSRRAERAFISVNCAAIPPSLIASELFGHEKGAFTGAVQQRRGRFELANFGTIFLDEIGEIPMETQVALLRVLQEHEVERLGGSRSVPVDVRVIAATNRDLSNAIRVGTFRSDLFYRLNVFPIQMPSLSHRKEDIPLLVEYFVKRFAEKMAKRISRIETRTLQLCEAYSWPGNIRELQNIVERSMILCSDDTFSIDEAWLSTQAVLTPKMTGMIQDREKELIESALAESRGKVAGATGAASKLGIPPSTLDSKIKQLRIEKDKFKSGR